MRGLLFALLLCSPGVSAEWETAVQGLRKYCKACHGVGNLRFIRSEDDAEVWSYLFEEMAPNSKKPWAEAITEVLSWPGGQPPAADEWMAPPDKDWMPKGVKRLWFARATENGEPLREVILRAIDDEQN